MRNAARLLISLSLAALPFYSLAVKPVLAEQVLGAQDAAAHLARAHAAAEKCGHLTQARLDELSSYVNAAEVVVAGQIGPDAVLRLMKRGQASGNAMACSHQTQELANAALEAAREAMQQAGDQNFRQAVYTDAPQDVEQVGFRPTLSDEQQAARIVEPLPEEHHVAAPAKVKKAEKREKPANRETARDATDLGRYTLAAAAYYVERRCGHLQHGQAVNFWKGVVAQHNSALASHKRADVARAKANAIAIANRTGGCSARTRRMVNSGLSLVR
jgi:hypothetical protein